VRETAWYVLPPLEATDRRGSGTGRSEAYEPLPCPLLSPRPTPGGSCTTNASTGRPEAPMTEHQSITCARSRGGGRRSGRYARRASTPSRCNPPDLKDRFQRCGALLYAGALIGLKLYSWSGD